MSQFTLTVALGNDVMQEPAEVAHALREVAEKLEDGQLSGVIQDANGNTVGAFGAHDDPEPFEDQ